MRSYGRSCSARRPRRATPRAWTWPARWGLGRDVLGTMRVAVLSDTHSPRRWKQCPAAVAERLRDVDLILHAGDVCTAGVLDELSAFAEVRAVLGNNDGADVAGWGAPETLELDMDGLSVGMIHDSGSADGRLERMRRRFPRAAAAWSRRGRGRVRPLPHPDERGGCAGVVGRRPADLQPGLAHRSTSPAARHDGPAHHHRRASGRRSDPRRHLSRAEQEQSRSLDRSARAAIAMTVRAEGGGQSKAVVSHRRLPRSIRLMRCWQPLRNRRPPRRSTRPDRRGR